MPRSSHFDVFLAHNSRDKPAVREIAEALTSRGLRPWLDEWELTPGMSWQDSLEETLKEIKSVAVLIGGGSLGPWESLELRAFLTSAIDRGVPVIPVLLPGAPDEPELPIFLRSFTCLDLRKGLSKELIDRLQWGITGTRPTSRSVRKDDENIDIFLCFLGRDRAVVQQIAEQLKREKIRSWPDDWSLSPDESWRQLLSRDFQRIGALAVFAGDEGGPWADDQVESFVWEFIEAGQLVIPAILPNATRDPLFPVYLRRKQIIDFRKSAPDPIALLANLLSVDRRKEVGSSNG